MKIIRTVLIIKDKNENRKNSIFQRIIYFNIYIKLFLLIILLYQDLLYEEKYLIYTKIKSQEKINRTKIDNKAKKFFKSLKIISFNNASLLSEYRQGILNCFSRYTHTKIDFIENLYFNPRYHFGNRLILFNKIIFYCEILKCKKILLKKNNKLFIKNKINDDRNNLTIEIVKSSKEINLSNSLSFILPHSFSKFIILRPENRFYIIKNEILKNIPFVKTKKNDLYIHIRSGDIFIKPHQDYSQPPYCFYQTIINKFKFNKITIISQNSLNPIINKLISKFPEIIFKQNEIKLDIACLVYSYNIVGSISSFLNGIIRLNDNLIKFWEYDIYSLKEKMLHFHHLLYHYKRNYTIFLMKPSKNYIEHMNIWTASKKQINIMLKDKCPNKFKIIRP